MYQYLELLQEVYEHGDVKTDRTGTGTKSLFGKQMRFDLRDGFPLVTTKEVNFASIIHELVWFISGDTTLKYLKQNNVNIWDEWVKEGTEVWGDALSVRQRSIIAKRRGKSVPSEWLQDTGNLVCSDQVHVWMDQHGIPCYELIDGELGPVYGQQWRNWPTPNGNTIDQLAETIKQLQNTPDSRRMIVSAWNPAQLSEMALPPCHTLFQFYVAGGALSCQLYQRSADLFLGAPYNIASYAALTHAVAEVTGLAVGEFIWTGGDCHIYSNHMEQVDRQLQRTPHKMPNMVIGNRDGDVIEPGSFNNIGDIKFENFILTGYEHHARIAAPVAV